MEIKPVSVKVRLKVKTPMAVGTGRSYSLFDYVVKEEKLLLIDFKKLIEKLKTAGRLREFKGLLKNFTPFDLIKLQRFYYQNVGFDEAKAVLSLKPSVATHFRKKFEKLGELLRSGRRGDYLREQGVFEVREVAKNPLNGEPFLPGSTLKGAIRTSLLNYLVKTGVIDKERFVRELLNAFREVGLEWPGVYSRKELGKFNFKRLREIFNQIDSHLLCEFSVDVGSSDFGRDLMRFVKVSDLSPSGEVSTSVGRPERKSRDGKESSFGFVEFVEPGALFEGTVTIYPEFVRKFMKCPLEIDSRLIVKALRSEYSKILHWEKDFFGKNPLPFTRKEMELYKSQGSPLAPVKLGFGAGALSKTLSDAPELRVVGNSYTGIRPEPVSISLMEDRPMGWCLLEVG